MQQEMSTGSSSSNKTQKKEGSTESNTEPKRKRIKAVLKSLNPHICALISKSRLGQNNDERHFDDVKRYYEALYEFDEMKDIMQLLAIAVKLTITFDFNHDSVIFIDPANPCPAEGRTYGTSEKIFIAGKRNNEFELLGTLAHEMTHLALYLIYNNGCLPYRPSDDKRREEFGAIVEKCRQLQTENKIIGKVFQDNIYNENEVPIELIVRVPQLIVLLLNYPEELTKQRKIFDVLFGFYEKFVEQDLKKEAAFAELKCKVREMNKNLGLFEMLVSNEQVINSQAKWSVEINKKLEDTFVETTLPELTMASLAGNLLYSEAEELVLSKNIFVKVHQLCSHKQNLSEVASLISDKFKLTFYVLDTENYNLSNCSELLSQFIVEARTVFVTNRPWKVLKDHFSSLQQKCLSIYWKDLTNKRKNELLDTMLNFQGRKVQLKDIWTEDSNILQNMLFESFVNLGEKNIEVSKHLSSNNVDLFIERNFKNLSENHQQFVFKPDEVICKLKTDRCVILADSAGMGKTTSAIHFAKSLREQNPIPWVAFVDLKEGTEAYIDNMQKETFEMNEEYFSQKLLKLETEFHLKLFSEFFKNSKVIFVVDGYDEISPKFNEFILTLLRYILDSGNSLLVTTRTHLVSDLENRLERSAIRLKPFDKADQIIFLVKFWGKKLPERTTDDLKTKAENLLEKFVNTLHHQDFVEVPLQLYMIAEVYGDVPSSEHMSLNLFSLYKDFVNKKIDIWVEKGPLAKIDNKEIQKGSVTVGPMHQSIAITSVFGAKEAKTQGIVAIDINLARELLTRIGLIREAINDHFEFVHKTYSEFFIAEFCYNKILAGLATTIQINMFKRVFLGNDYESIRKFINEKLRTVDYSEFATFWGNIKKIFGEKDQRTFLYYDNQGVLAYFLATDTEVEMVLGNIRQSDLSESEFQSYLLNNDWLVDVLCSFAFAAKPEVFLKLWQFVENNFELEEIQNFCF